MKKLLITLTLILLTSTYFGQSGLTNIIVEEIDASAAMPGAITYRVFVDLEPNYQLLQVFGNSTNPLSIATTGTWYNNEYGAISGDLINVDFLSTPLNTSMPNLTFDSYISLGAASSKELGKPFSDDTDGSIDGRSLADHIPAVSFIGQTVKANAAANFDMVSTSSSFLMNGDGGFFTLSNKTDFGSENKVLIGQFTTDGDFSFSLNIQTKMPETNELSIYLASDTPLLNFPIPGGNLLDGE